MKITERKKAIELRKKGKSYREILNRIKVSKGTLSIWLRDIKLTPNQKKRLYITLRRKNAYLGAKKKQQQRIKNTKEIIKQAKKEAQKKINNKLFLTGLMLYWAEGDKSDEREIVKFTNSDPEMIKLMMKWFDQICYVPKNKYRICLHIHSLHSRKNIEIYWSTITKIPISQFIKIQIKATSLTHRKNILYNGTCAIKICDKNLFRKIKGWKLGCIDLFNKMY